MAGPGLVITPNLRPYQPRVYTDDPASQTSYLANELKNLANTNAALVSAAKALEARLVAAGI
jgi:hypothetical protein